MSCIDVTVPPITGDRPLLFVSAAALIDQDNRVLLARRPPGKAMAGLWEYPGGKVGSLETPEQALVRELHEELGIETSVGCLWPLSFASHAYEKFHLFMPLYSCRVWEGAPEAKEGQELQWASKHDLKNFQMPPADVGLTQALWEML